MVTPCMQTAFRIAAKPLMQLRLIDSYYTTARRNSSLPYSTVPSPAPYDLRFSHDTCVTDRLTTRIHLPNARPIAKGNGQPKIIIQTLLYLSIRIM